MRMRTLQYEYKLALTHEHNHPKSKGGGGEHVIINYDNIFFWHRGEGIYNLLHIPPDGGDPNVLASLFGIWQRLTIF